MNQSLNIGTIDWNCYFISATKKKRDQGRWTPSLTVKVKSKKKKKIIVRKSQIETTES
jgi:hypothetical protein